MHKKYKELFNLFRLLSEPANKRERESWKQAMHTFRHRKEDLDYRAVRQKFIYPQLLRVLLKTEKAKKLKEAFDGAIKNSVIHAVINHCLYCSELSKDPLANTKKMLSVYRSFAMPAFLAQKADLDDEFVRVHNFENEHIADFTGGSKCNDWIWKNLALEIVRALNSTCTKENLEYYSEKYSREKVNFLIKTLVEIAGKFGEIKNCAELVKKFQAGEAQPKNYSTKGLRRYKVKKSVEKMKIYDSNSNITVKEN